MASPIDTEDDKLFGAIFRMNSNVFGLVAGVLFGLAIFIVTNWLVIKGGHVNAEGEYVVGPHLQLKSYWVCLWVCRRHHCGGSGRVDLQQDRRLQKLTGRDFS
ncbi:MAG: hypothetical protein DYH03_09900 [Nitrospira sp. NTP1]|nr:hypothetical protein [Nitrospira sp. NTP1]